MSFSISEIVFNGTKACDLSIIQLSCCMLERKCRCSARSFRLMGMHERVYDALASVAILEGIVILVLSLAILVLITEGCFCDLKGLC